MKVAPHLETLGIWGMDFLSFQIIAHTPRLRDCRLYLRSWRIRDYENPYIGQSTAPARLTSLVITSWHAQTVNDGLRTLMQRSAAFDLSSLDKLRLHANEMNLNVTVEETLVQLLNTCRDTLQHLDITPGMCVSPRLTLARLSRLNTVTMRCVRMWAQHDVHELRGLRALAAVGPLQSLTLTFVLDVKMRQDHRRWRAVDGIIAAEGVQATVGAAVTLVLHWVACEDGDYDQLTRQILENLPHLCARAQVTIQHTDVGDSPYPALRGADILDPFVPFCPLDWTLSA